MSAICPDGYIDDNLDDDEADEQPIRCMAGDCNKLFAECLTRSFDSHEHWMSLQIIHMIKEYYRRFEGWCTFLGVFADEVAALDYRLRRHTVLQDMIIRMLDMLRQNLFLVTIHDLPNANGQVTNTSPPSLTTEIFPGISEAITRLNKTGVAIRSSSRSIATARARRFASQYPELVPLSEFEDRISLVLDFLYPNSAETLRKQLVDSTTDRYAKLRYEVYRNKANSKSESLATGIQSVVQNTGIESLSETQVQFSFEMGGDEARKKGRKVAMVIPASSIDTTLLPLDLEQVIAPSITQSKPPKTLTRHVDQPREPDLPKFRSGEDYASCEWCHQVVDRSVLHTTQKRWSDKGRHHYRQDLQPYVCLAEECRESRPSFASSRAWFGHMKSSHTESWSFKVHNQLSWTCVASHENNSTYTFPYKEGLLEHIRAHQCKTWRCTGEHEKGSRYAYYSKDELLQHISECKFSGKIDTNGSNDKYPENLAQTMRQASSCPLCLFTIDEQPLDERLVANDSSDQNRNTSWAMGSHVADHLHHLMIISLQIMSAMQVSHNEDQDQRQGHPQSQSSGPSTAFSALDDGEMRKRLNDLPDSISGSMNMSESYQETAWISVMQEKSLSMADNMASLALTYISQDLWTQAEVLEEQVTEARKEVLGSEHPDTLVSINQLGVIFASQGKNEDAKSMYQQALQGRIKVLGAEHPNTLASMTSLAAIYKDLGQWEEAEKLERLRLASHTSIGPERDGHSPPSGTNTRVPLTDATQGRRKRRYSGSLKVIQRPLSSDSEIWNISDLSNDFLAESLRWHPTERDIESLASPHHYNVVADVSYSIPLIFGFGPAIKVSVHPLRIRDLPFLCHNHVIYEWPPSSAPPQTYSHLVLPATMSQDSMTNLPTDLDNHLSLLVKSHFRSFPLYCSPITVLREVYVLYLSLPQNTHEHLLEQALKLLTLVHLSGDITIPSPSTNSVLDELIGSTMTLEEPLATTPCFIRAQFGTIAQTLALSLMKEVLLSLEELSLKNGLRVWPVALATLMLVLMTIESIQYHASKLPYHHNYDSTESKPGSESQLENEDAVKSLLAFYTARFGDYHSRLHDMRDRTATGSSDLDMNPEDKFIENIREMIKKISLGEYAVRRAGAERVDQDMQWFFDRLVARLLVLDTK